MPRRVMSRHEPMNSPPAAPASVPTGPPKSPIRPPIAAPARAFGAPLPTASLSDRLPCSSLAATPTVRSSIA